MLRQCASSLDVLITFKAFSYSVFEFHFFHRIRQAMRIQKQMTSRPETVEDQKKEYNMSIVLVIKPNLT